MVQYNFKNIQVVPDGTEIINIVLSKTMRGTPTVVHKHYHISRIRKFYMRKVRYCQQITHDRLSRIITEFPVMEELHPFYASLVNVLYDKDHYKLALGQLNTACHLIDTLSKDYVRLLKYGDSMYRCKQLKRAALGRMVTILKKQKASLAYLEQVRQHLARLPSIDPSTRTLLVCGYPNVGKSSFMNKVTRANCEVEPYAFTTKSLFVGHMDYKYLRWQVIDTPGILDHEIQERNTIEMQSVTALAHLRCCVLFFIDISEACGYSIKQQVSLFKNIRPLFTNKPLVLVLNKIDLVKLEELNDSDRALIDEIVKDNPAAGSVQVIPMSNVNEDNVAKVKETACEILLAQRTEQKLLSREIKAKAHRLHVAIPERRDDIERPPSIPDTVGKSDGAVAKQKFEDFIRQQMLYEGLDADWTGIDLKKYYMLEDDEWRWDAIPEIMEGENIADWVAPDSEERFIELLKEEEDRLRELGERLKKLDPSKWTLTPEEKSLLKRIRDKKRVMIWNSRLENSRGGRKLPRNKFHAVTLIDENVTVKDHNGNATKIDAMAEHLRGMGLDPTLAVERLRDRSRSRGRGLSSERSAVGSKRKRTVSQSPETSKSRARILKMTPGEGEGYRNVKQKLAACKRARLDNKKRWSGAGGKCGPGDKAVYDTKGIHYLKMKNKNSKMR
mmetsp:Transcript_15977/g.17738  ORF Transcript_15977/g.17738 Transcript_15977/m.17738 type:complete len:671 (-) Transcript_15977:143-2155(-)